MESASLKRIVIACGGTGGHFYPGYTIAKALRSRSWETLFLLRKDDPAAKILQGEDLPFVEVDLRGMPRDLSSRWFKFPFQVLGSLSAAKKILRSFQPRCVLGMGGYLTFPTILTAWRLSIPSMIHEANSILGLANRMCGPFVTRIALGLPLSNGASAGSKYQLTGIPIRPEFEHLPSAAAGRKDLGLDPEKPTVLLFGGSQGAKLINELAPKALLELAARHPNSFQCLHVTGPAGESGVTAAYSNGKFRAVVKPYLQDIFRAYAAADIVISRSGASTLAELSATKKPAILIPLPFATGGHQDQNAALLENAGAALRFRQADLTPAILAKAVEDLIFLAAPGKLSKMSDNYSQLGLPSPGQCVAGIVTMIENL